MSRTRKRGDMQKKNTKRDMSKIKQARHLKMHTKTDATDINKQEDVPE